MSSITSSYETLKASPKTIVIGLLIASLAFVIANLWSATIEEFFENITPQKISLTRKWVYWVLRVVFTVVMTTIFVLFLIFLGKVLKD